MWGYAAGREGRKRCSGINGPSPLSALASGHWEVLEAHVCGVGGLGSPASPLTGGGREGERQSCEGWDGVFCRGLRGRGEEPLRCEC